MLLSQFKNSSFQHFLLAPQLKNSPKYGKTVSKSIATKLKLPSKMFKYTFSNIRQPIGDDTMTNPVLDAIKNRRSVIRFEETPIEEEKVEAILEAGRWAPSWLNRQPWSFIVTTDQNIKERLSEAVPTVFTQGLKEAPVCIAVVIDTTEDPFHFVEDGAIASQNMVLAAYSLGLYSCWIGIFDSEGGKNSAEARVREILEVPRTHRVISLLPFGHPRYEIPKKERKTLYHLVYRNEFGKR